jgi:hypothetical protein
VIRSRCEEIGRDPDTLRVAVHVWGEAGDVAPGARRQQRLKEYAALGLSRVVLQGFAAVSDPGVLDSLADDCAAASLLDPARPAA